MNKIIGHIEIEKGSRQKFELDKELGTTFILDRELSISYPEAYGYIRHTLSGDGDPLDVFVVSNDPLKQGTYVVLEPVAAIRYTDNEEEDTKILASTVGYNEDYKAIEPAIIGDIAEFLTTYKIGGHITNIITYKSGVMALIKEAQERYDLSHR